MPTRKVLTNGWLYWLARHSTLGLVLLDEANQGGLPHGTLRAFILRWRRTDEFDRNDFKRHLSSEVSDPDFVQIVTAYNDFKHQIGLPLKAGPDVAHHNFLRKRGLPSYGVRARTKGKLHRVTHCWSCKGPLDNSVDIECNNCGWIICTCGACNCGRNTEP